MRGKGCLIRFLTLWSQFACAKPRRNASILVKHPSFPAKPAVRSHMDEQELGSNGKQFNQ
jgi:hypothetical protein